jgi:aminodeoxyfutalosine deaminase
VTFPKIELHVHLEGTVRPETLLEIARRNDYPLPADTVEEVARLYDYRDFAHFIEVWILTTNAPRTRDDFRQIVVAYAAEVAEHGAVYLEGDLLAGGACEPRRELG